MEQLRQLLSEVLSTQSKHGDTTVNEAAQRCCRIYQSIDQVSWIDIVPDTTFTHSVNVLSSRVSATFCSCSAGNSASTDRKHRKQLDSSLTHHRNHRQPMVRRVPPCAPNSCFATHFSRLCTASSTVSSTSLAGWDSWCNFAAIYW